MDSGFQGLGDGMRDLRQCNGTGGGGGMESGYPGGPWIARECSDGGTEKVR